MSDEIKETIQYFRNYDEGDNITITCDFIMNIDFLINYITNLQEENDILKRDIEAMKHNCEEAREMIRFIAYNSERPLTITELNKVYNILGGDE